MRYYGNKTKLLDFISATAGKLDISDNKLFFDVFTGTTSVAKHFKELGYRVLANDWLYFSYVLATTNIALSKKPDFIQLSKTLGFNSHSDIFNYLNHLDPIPDFISKNYTPYKGNHRQYFSVENGAKIDSIRAQINSWQDIRLITNEEACYLITSLINAVNKVSNVSGTYGSYLKKWDKRAFKTLQLIEPNIAYSDKNHMSFNDDAETIVKKYEVDILYLDPPYNARQYASNYFLLELIAEGWFTKKPEIYGHTGMRPYEHQKSQFSMKREAAAALKRLVDSAKAKYILLSYNNEGIIKKEDVSDILSSRGTVSIETFEHRRYRSVGQDGSKSKTTEYLYVLKLRNY